MAPRTRPSKGDEPVRAGVGRVARPKTEDKGIVGAITDYQKALLQKTGPVLLFDLLRGKYNDEIANEVKSSVKSMGGTLGRYSTPAQVVRLATGNSPLTSSEARGEYRENVLPDLINALSIIGTAKATPGAIENVQNSALLNQIRNRGTSPALHFSHIPGLPEIVDIPSMRNLGANANTRYFRENPGTYAYDLQSASLPRALEAALTELTSSARMNPDRTYSLYVTRAKPFVKDIVGRVKDPEYGSSLLAGDAGQGIFGTQKVVSEIPIDAKFLVDNIESLYGDAVKGMRQADYNALRLELEKQLGDYTDSILQQIINNPKNLRSGVVAPDIANPSTAYRNFGGGTVEPIPFTPSYVPRESALYNQLAGLLARVRR